MPSGFVSSAITARNNPICNQPLPVIKNSPASAAHTAGTRTAKWKSESAKYSRSSPPPSFQLFAALQIHNPQRNKNNRPRNKQNVAHQNLPNLLQPNAPTIRKT